MSPNQLGELLIELFEGYTFEEVLSYSENMDNFKQLIGDKLGQDKAEHIYNIDAITWIEAFKILYASYC